MKIWEVLKEENKGKRYRCLNDNKPYEVYKAVGGLNLREYKTAHYNKVIEFDVYNFMELEFEQTYEEIAFEDILKVKETCKYKVEHEFIDKITEYYTEDATVERVVFELKEKKWMCFCDIMLAISYSYCSDAIKDILSNGTWYIKRD